MTDFSISKVLSSAVDKLKMSGSDSPSLDATVLLCEVLDKPRAYLLTWPEKELSSEQYQQFKQLIERRVHGEPIAYIVGWREFWSLPLKVSPATLIPRPDSERLVEVALEKTQCQQGAILDLGTGTGAIALALASELPHRQVIGIELQPEAYQLAGENAQQLAITNVHFLQGSWFTPLNDLQLDNRIIKKREDGKICFSLIVSNPPYIEPDDPHLTQGDVRFEPLSALVAEQQGLADIIDIATNAKTYLDNDGWLIIEHGYYQGEAVRRLLTQLGYQHVSTQLDYAGLERITLGQRS